MVRGRVLDEHDRPLRNAIVSDGVHTVVSDGDGRFTLVDTPLDGHFGITACGYLDALVSAGGPDLDQIALIRDR